MIDFAIWLAICRPSGRPISAKSISKYLGQVRLWHLEEFRMDIIGELDLSQLKAVVKGIAGIQQPPALDRWGVRTQDLAKAIEQCLHPQSATDANWAAGLTAALCGLLRGAEFALQECEAFDPSRHLTRADVKFFEKDGVWYAIIRMRPAKKAGDTKTLPLVLGVPGRRRHATRPSSGAPAPLCYRPGARGADGDDAAVPARPTAGRPSRSRMYGRWSRR